MKARSVRLKILEQCLVGFLRSVEISKYFFKQFFFSGTDLLEEARQ